MMDRMEWLYGALGTIVGAIGTAIIMWTRVATARALARGSVEDDIRRAEAQRELEERPVLVDYLIAEIERLRADVDELRAETRRLHSRIRELEVERPVVERIRHAAG